MIKKIIIPFIFCVSLLGCHEEASYKNRFTLVPSNDNISIKLGSSSRNKSSFIQNFTLSDRDYLALEKDKQLNSIEVYNIDAGLLVNVISINNEGSNAFPYVTGFKMDNITRLIAISPTLRQIGLINSNGDVLKKISYGKDTNGRNVQGSTPLGSIRPILIDSTLFLCENYGAEESSGILTTTKQKHTFLNVAIDLTSGQCKSLPLTYPAELIGQDISGMRVCRTLGFNNCFIYHFGILNALFVTNDNISFKKMPIETNYSLKFEQNHWKYMADLSTGMRRRITYDEVHNIYYDKYRECYYLLVRQREENLEKNPDFRTKFVYPHCFITIFDKNLKFMGDVFFPDDTYSFQMMFISPIGLYISEDHVNNPSYSENYMRFRLFKLKKI